MALANSQLNPLILRNRSVARHAQHSVPSLDNINAHMDHYINAIKDQILSLSYKQQIHYWSSKVSESVHICMDVLLPEFDNFTNIVMLRWITIGHAIYQLIELWKTNRRNIQTHTRIDEWLPYIVKQKLPPNLIPRGTYKQLRKYVIMFENRELITVIPTLRNEHTHRLNEMNRWIREFNEKVQLMATQRNIAIPQHLNERIDLYNVYRAHHSQPLQSDDENDECHTLDTLMAQYLPGINVISDSDSDIDIDSDNESKDDQKMAELVENVNKKKKGKKLSTKDAKILNYREKIKQLKAELSETKKILKKTKYSHCQALRERHVYRELHREHKSDMDGLHQLVNGKNMQIQRLQGNNIQLQKALMDCKGFIKILRQKYIECKQMSHELSSNSNSICSCCNNRYSNSNSCRSSGSFNEILPENSEINYQQNGNECNNNNETDTSQSFMDRNIGSTAAVLYKNVYRNYKRNKEPIRSKIKKAKRNGNKRDNVMISAHCNASNYLSSSTNSQMSDTKRYGISGNVQDLKEYISTLKEKKRKWKDKYHNVKIKLNEMKSKN